MIKKSTVIVWFAALAAHRTQCQSAVEQDPLRLTEITIEPAGHFQNWLKLVNAIWSAAFDLKQTSRDILSKATNQDGSVFFTNSNSKFSSQSLTAIFSFFSFLIFCYPHKTGFLKNEIVDICLKKIKYSG